MIEKRGKVRFRHADTAQVYEIHADEIDFEAVSAHERDMGQETEHSAEVNHPKLGLLRWILWEYPVGVVNDRDTEHGQHELLEDIGLEFRDEPPTDDDD